MGALDFDREERAVLAGLADALIPAGEGMPAASAAGVAGGGLDRVLQARPDLAAEVKRVLAAARGRDPAAALSELRAKDPAGFSALAELVPGAYFMDPEVRALIGYQGQTARPIDPDPESLLSDLLRPVLERGPIYRPTPGGDQLQR